MGRLTRTAIDQFSTRYDAPNDPDRLFHWFITQAVRNSTEITDEPSLEQIRLSASQYMKDPATTQLRKVRWQNGPNGRFICGEINGKNSYGAYAGFVSFASIGEGFGDELPTIYWLDGQAYDGQAFWRCTLSFPKR
jgi:hypothetical protein